MDIFTRLTHPCPLSLWRHASRSLAGAGQPVLYIHGATFPIALSVGHRFDGYSWADSLNAAGFDVWGLDFAGYGASRGEHLPTVPASEQIASAVTAILSETSYAQIVIIAHSWGSIPIGMFSTACSDKIKALILFGPIAQRRGTADATLEGWKLITADDQYRRFVEDVPAGESQVLSRVHFDGWAPKWLATDPSNAERNPPSVRVPCHAYNDLAAAWGGHLGYDPGALACPTLIVHGAWDKVCDADDIAWFRGRVPAPLFHEATVACGTHLLHLEANRFALYAACEDFIRQQLRIKP